MTSLEVVQRYRVKCETYYRNSNDNKTAVSKSVKERSSMLYK